jgi:hypothetical protein
MGCGGSSGCRLGRDFAGSLSHRPIAPHDHGWTEGAGTFGEESACRWGTRAVSGWRAPDTDAIRSWIAGGPGAVDRSRHTRRKVPRRMELLGQTATLKLVKVIRSPCLNRTVRKGFSTLAVKGTHFRSVRAPSSRVQPLTFDHLGAAPDRSPGFYSRLCASC